MIFVVAFGVRFLSWQDNHREAWKVQTYVTSGYKDSARQLSRGDLRAFLGDINQLGHPPGYPILLAAMFRVFGESDTAIQFLQITLDSLSAIFVFLIASELFSFCTATLAGILAALSPQFAYYSVLILPDSPVVLPILIAIYFLARAVRRPRVLMFVGVGAVVSLSCWLRPNALLLTPLLVCLTALILSSGQRLRHASALLLGFVALIAPITIKNAIVFHRFIPVSLGAGQTMLEGISDYDAENRFGIPRTDLGLMKQEAEAYNRADYALTLFGPDGIQRERWRLHRGLNVIVTHPIWFGGVMLRRGSSFLRVDRVPVTAADPPVSHPLDVSTLAPVLTVSPKDLIANATFISPEARVSSDDSILRIESDATKYGDQVVSPVIAVARHHDYLLRLPLKLEDGRVVVKVTDDAQSHLLSSENIDLLESLGGPDQPATNIAIPFVTGNESQVRVALANNAPESSRSVAQIGHVELFDLGSNSQEWTRYLRFPIRILQKFFVTAVIIPLVILGIGVLLWTRNYRTLILILVVPVYYLIFQSALHTERRYVLVIQYFFLTISAVILSLPARSIKRAGSLVLSRRKS